MINIIQTPKENEAYVNTAPITIIVDSLLGNGYYFKINIFVNGQLYDEQFRAKVNSTRLEVDFNGMVADVFNEPYQEPVGSAIVANPNLIKLVQVVVEEYQESTGLLVNSLGLPTFYVVNAQQPKNIALTHLTNLSVYTDHVKTPPNGVLNLPFFSKTATTVTLHKNNVVVQSLISPDAIGIYNAHFLLSNYNLSEDDDVFIMVETPTHNYTLRVVIQSIIPYTVNLLIFKNNHHAWEHFYCFGEQKNTQDIIRKQLELTDNLQYNYKNITKPVYEINTGTYHNNYINTVNNLLASTHVMLSTASGNIAVNFKNTKTTPSKTRLYTYDTYLTLEENHDYSNNADIVYFAPPSLGNIIINGQENTNIEILKADILALYGGNNPLYFVFDEMPFGFDVYVNVNGNDVYAFQNQGFAFDAFSKITLIGGGYGTPLDTFKFHIEGLPPENYSNIATATINVAMYDPLNQAPVISVATETYVYVDATSKTIVANVIEPDGDPFTVLWQQTSGQAITMSAQTSQTLLLSNWTAPGEYEFLITARDNRGNTATQTTKLIVMDYKVSIETSENAIKIVGGKIGEDCLLKITLQNHSNLKADAVQYDDSSIGYTKKLLIGGNVCIIQKGSAFRAYNEEFVQTFFTKLNITHQENNFTIPVEFNSSTTVTIPISTVLDNSTISGYNGSGLKHDLRVQVGVEITNLSSGILRGPINSITFPVNHIGQ